MKTPKNSSQPFPDTTASDIECLSTRCQGKFTQLFTFVKNARHQDAYQVEVSLFKHLMQLGLLLLQLFFASHHAGDYGSTLKTTKGIAIRGRLSHKSYYSIFGKLSVKRYLHDIGEDRFAPLDIVLNLAVRCYSYFLSEWVNHLNVKDAYHETVRLLKTFFELPLPVSAVETLTQDSATEYETYYELRALCPGTMQESAPSPQPESAPQPKPTS